MPAAAPRFVQRKAVETRSAVTVQTSLKVSSPQDSAEKEASQTAQKIMRMASPESSIAYVQTGSPGVFRKTSGNDEKEKKLHTRLESPYITRFQGSGIFSQSAGIQCKSEGQPDVGANIAAEIQNSQSSGSPLPPTVRRFMEPRFQADFSQIKIHTNDKSAKLNRQLNAHAFAVGNSIFFGKDKFKPDTHDGKELIAHELTHTIQQGAAVQRSENVTVIQQSPPMVQRGIISEALDYFADKAYNIPGFRMFTIVIGFNPINMERADRSAANILRAIIEFLPGGHLITDALENHGVFQKVGAWVEQQFATLASIGTEFKQSLDDFIDSLGWRDVFHLGRVWDRAKALFTNPVVRLINFAKSLFNGIIKFIKDAILHPLAKLAEGTRAYDLLKAVLGEDPITGDKVPQNADTLIGGFMKLIGQEEIWANIKRANALPRAWAWFKGALNGLLGLVRSIPGRFIAAFSALTIMDIVLVPRAFTKIVAVFLGIAGDFIQWAGGTIWNLLEIIFDVVSPGALVYIKKTGAALKSILKHPLPFVGNLVKAAKLGFQSFAAHFGTHLKESLIDWLTGAMPGVYIPNALSLPEIGKFVLSVLGISWTNIRGKFVQALGPTGEKIMSALETTFDVVVALVKGGPAAAWEVIKDKLANLKDMVISGITDFVIDIVVNKAVPKLIAMFIPGAGFISAILSIYDTVMVFVHKISQIIQVVTGFINSIVIIAAGNVAGAAKRVESILAGLLTLAINFLTGFAGLGKVADKIMGVIKKVQTVVDKALDTAINWIVGKAKTLFAKLFGMAQSAAKKLFNWGATKSAFADEDGHNHSLYVQASGGTPKLVIASSPTGAEQFLDFYVNKKGADFAKDNAAKISAVRTAIAAANVVVNQIDAGQKAGQDEAALQPLQQSLLEKNVAVTSTLGKLINSDTTIGKTRQKYLLEGVTGTYASIPKPSGDSFTADHQPQAAILQAAAEFDYFSDTGDLAKRAAGRAQQGYAINLHHIRHTAGSTYGSKGKATKEGFLARLKPLVKGKKRAEQRQIVVAQIKSDMLRDVAAMKGAAAPGSANWADIKGLSAKKEEKETLINEVSGRIMSGESQIAAQNFDSLVN